MALLELKEGIKAKTNIIDIEDDVIENINKLLNYNRNKGVFIDYGIRTFQQDITSKEVKEFWQNMHIEIKNIIRDELSLAKAENIKYDFLYIKENHQYKVCFLYVSAKKNINYNEVINELINSNIQPHKIFESLISLHLKLEFIEKFKELYEFEPSYYNAELYLNTSKIGTVLDTLYPKIYFSEYNEIVISLHKKVFKITKDELIASIPDTALAFRSKKTSYYAIDDDLSATKYSKKKFINFNEYNDSINHTQNLLSNTLQNILKKCNINNKYRCFQANHALKNFLKVENKEISRKLIIIDNLTAKDDKLKQQLHDRLQQEFPNSIIQTTIDYPDFNSLNHDNNYLILNTSSKYNGSSVMVADKKKNTFWDAFKAYLKNKNVTLDYFSRLKIDWFISDEDRLTVLQGLNIADIKKELDIKPKSTKDNIYNKLKKIKTEIWLKEQVFHKKKLLEINLVDKNLTLIYIRKLRKYKKYDKDSFNAAVVDVTIKDKKIIIKKDMLLDSENQLRHNFTYFEKREKLYNDSFFIIDNTAKVMLMSYNSTRIPQIIGNSIVDNIKLADNNDNKLSRQATKPTEIVLPYYLAKTQERQIYLEQSNNDLLYFITPSVQPNATIEKQNLIYNILTFNKNGELLTALKQDVTTLFLNSFTEDVLKNNEYSKSSILEKIAKLYIEN